jgi:bacteriorhodopsin
MDIKKFIYNPVIVSKDYPESITKIFNITLYSTFYIFILAHIILLIVFFVTKIPEYPSILFLELIVTGTAGTVYYYIIDKTFKNNTEIINWKQITNLRYIDWTITTPIMLYALCMILGYYSKTEVTLSLLIMIFILDLLMLFFGYLGELKIINKPISTLLGFIPFIIIFYIIYDIFIKNKFNFKNILLFSVYFVLWALYGLVYMLDDIHKNIMFNIQDSIAKGFIAFTLCFFALI